LNANWKKERSGINGFRSRSATRGVCKRREPEKSLDEVRGLNWLVRGPRSLPKKPYGIGQEKEATIQRKKTGKRRRDELSKDASRGRGGVEKICNAKNRWEKRKPRTLPQSEGPGVEFGK